MKHSLYPVAVMILLLLLLLGHFIVYETLTSILGITDLNLLLWMKVFIVVLCSGFAAASIISYYANNLSTRIFYTITASWIGFFIYYFIASVCYGLILLFGDFGFFDIHIRLIGLILFVGATCVSIIGIINARYIKITTLSISLKNTPEYWKGKTAVWLSDIHLGQVYNTRQSDRIVRKIQKLNPDIIFVGGDLYDGVAVDVVSSIEPFKKLNPPLGVFFITGNHEEFLNNKIYLEAVKNVGMKVLYNEIVTIKGMQIGGVDYHDTVGVKRFSEVLSHLSLDRDLPSILLKHVPLDLDLAEQKGFQLQISGHTHQGQVFPFSVVTKILYHGYEYGLKKFNTMLVYTSSGVGGWGPPLRVGTKSEIVHITFN